MRGGAWKHEQSAGGGGEGFDGGHNGRDSAVASGPSVRHCQGEAAVAADGGHLQRHCQVQWCLGRGEEDHGQRGAQGVVPWPQCAPGGRGALQRSAVHCPWPDGSDSFS